MFIGVDVGGTSIKAGRVYKGSVIKKVEVPTEAGLGKERVIKNVLKAVELLFDKDIKGIGIGCPGPADYKKGIILNAPNLPLNGVNLKKIVARRFNVRVLIDNDANCFILGEALRLKKDIVVGLTLGTGVGGGIVINGRLFHGRGNAGELGHCTINFNGPKDACGNNGCLEQYISIKGIKRQFGKEPKGLNKKEWERFGMYLGVGIANLVNIFNPDIFVLGGGIANAFGEFKGSMYKEIQKRALSKIRVVKGQNNSAILGAATLLS